jgi:hypothetical protein
LNSIPAAIPYLQADPALTEKWGKMLRPADGRLKAGIAWAGNPGFRPDARRSLNLQQFTPLAAARGVRFYSLQKGPAGRQAEDPPGGLELIDLGPELSDFADTAAVIENFDLVISVDTAVAHLAGAMGKPVWVLIPFPPDWRWLLDRADSPWYPTMRLFRQQTPGDWDGVIRRVAAELSQYKSNRH